MGAEGECISVAYVGKPGVLAKRAVCCMWGVVGVHSGGLSSRGGGGYKWGFLYTAGEGRVGTFLGLACPCLPGTLMHPRPLLPLSQIHFKLLLLTKTRSFAAPLFVSPPPPPAPLPQGPPRRPKSEFYTLTQTPPLATEQTAQCNPKMRNPQMWTYKPPKCCKTPLVVPKSPPNCPKKNPNCTKNPPL